MVGSGSMVRFVIIAVFVVILWLLQALGLLSGVGI